MDKVAESTFIPVHKPPGLHSTGHYLSNIISKECIFSYEN